MPNTERPEQRETRPVPPSLAARGERRRIERRLQEAGVLCQPETSLQYQTLAKRSVLRGVESGGASKEIGRYVTFCDERGDSIPWLQPIDSVAVNGRHAVVVAPALVSVEVFRVRNTYDVLIVRTRCRATVGRSTRSHRGEGPVSGPPRILAVGSDRRRERAWRAKSFLNSLVRQANVSTFRRSS